MAAQEIKSNNICEIHRKPKYLTIPFTNRHTAEKSYKNQILCIRAAC